MAETAELIPEIDKSLEKVSKARAKSQTPIVQPTEAQNPQEEVKPVVDEVKPTEKVKPEDDKPKAEDKPKPEKKKFWKPEDKKPDAPAEQVKPVEQTVADTSLAELQKKVEQYEKLLSKKSVKSVLKAEESGKDFYESYAEMAKRDPFNMSYEDLYKMQLDEDGYTETEKQRKLENFSAKEEDDQADIISKFRKDLKTKWNKELEDYTPKFESQEPVNDPNKNFHQELEAVAKTFENKEFYGILATPDMIKKAIDPNSSIIKVGADGTIDKEDYLRVKLIVDNLPLIAQTIEDQVTAEITEKWEKMTGGNLPPTNGTALPQSPQKATDVEKRMAALKASLPHAGQKP